MTPSLRCDPNDPPHRLIRSRSQIQARGLGSAFAPEQLISSYIGDKRDGCQLGVFLAWDFSQALVGPGVSLLRG